MGNQFPNSYGLVLDEVLLVEAIFLVKLFHFAVDDFFDNRLGLSRGAGLGYGDFTFPVEDFLRYFLATNVTRIERSHMHGHVVAQVAEIIGTRHEIGFAIHFDEDANFPAGMNIMADHAFGGLPRRFLLRGGLPFFSQDVNGALHIAFGFHQRRAAIGKSCAGAFAQIFHELR